MTDYPNNIPAKLEIIKASEITPKEVRWLWYPYILFGKVTLLQGDPGDGKSKLMLSLAALLSKGAPLSFADEDDRGNRIPFRIERNAFDCSYDIMNGIAPQSPVNTDTNYHIVLDASVLQLSCEYKIFLVGTKLNYGDSDERTECVSGCSNGYCIALGCYSPNDDEKMEQAYDYSEKKGF